MRLSAATAAEIRARSSRFTSTLSGPFSWTNAQPSTARATSGSKRSRLREAPSARPIRSSVSQNPSMSVRRRFSAPSAGSGRSDVKPLRRGSRRPNWRQSRRYRRRRSCPIMAPRPWFKLHYGNRRNGPSQFGGARRQVRVAVLSTPLKRCGRSVLSSRCSPSTFTNRT
jgi:hypothetical protein